MAAYRALTQKGSTDRLDTLKLEYESNHAKALESGSLDQAMYDSSLLELMAVSWEKRTLQRYAPWATDEIQVLEERLSKARRLRSDNK